MEENQELRVWRGGKGRCQEALAKFPGLHRLHFPPKLEYKRAGFNNETSGAFFQGRFTHPLEPSS